MIIAQLSDIHADGSRLPLERLDRLLGWLRPLRPDAIIISGDLAQADHADSYGQIAERIDDLGAPFFAVPGNVDDHPALVTVLGERMGWSASPLNVAGEVGPLRLIGLDVTVRGAAHGDAAPVLAWLEEQLAEDDRPALIFQHQHPFPCGIDGADRNICFNGEALAEVIEAAGDKVIALTCGHVHRPLFTSFAGRPAMMGPSVTTPNRLHLDGKTAEMADPSGLMVHHYADGRLVSHVAMVG